MKEEVLHVRRVELVINCYKEIFDTILHICLSKYVLAIKRQPFFLHLKHNFCFGKD